MLGGDFMDISAKQFNKQFETIPKPRTARSGTVAAQTPKEFQMFTPQELKNLGKARPQPLTTKPSPSTPFKFTGKTEGATVGLPQFAIFEDLKLVQQPDILPGTQAGVISIGQQFAAQELDAMLARSIGRSSQLGVGSIVAQTGKASTGKPQQLMSLTPQTFSLKPLTIAKPSTRSQVNIKPLIDLKPAQGTIPQLDLRPMQIQSVKQSQKSAQKVQPLLELTNLGLGAPLAPMKGISPALPLPLPIFGGGGGGGEAQTSSYLDIKRYRNEFQESQDIFLNKLLGTGNPSSRRPKTSKRSRATASHYLKKVIG